MINYYLSISNQYKTYLLNLLSVLLANSSSIDELASKYSCFLIISILNASKQSWERPCNVAKRWHVHLASSNNLRSRSVRPTRKPRKVVPGSMAGHPLDPVPQFRGSLFVLFSHSFISLPLSIPLLLIPSASLPIFHWHKALYSLPHFS